MRLQIQNYVTEQPLQWNVILMFAIAAAAAAVVVVTL